MPALIHPLPTRLEFFWLHSPALRGQNLDPNRFVSAAVDFDGVYPVELLRLFLPQPADLLTLVDHERGSGDFRDWWLMQAIRRLPVHRFAYNTMSGRSGFGVGCCGGSFALKEYAQHAFTVSGANWPPQYQSLTIPAIDPRPLLLNSFDLAALVQLAYSLLLDHRGWEAQPTRWVCKTPFGKIAPSMPYGYSTSYTPTVSWERGINNPYFWGMSKSRSPSLTSPPSR